MAFDPKVKLFQIFSKNYLLSILLLHWSVSSWQQIQILIFPNLNQKSRTSWFFHSQKIVKEILNFWGFQFSLFLANDTYYDFSNGGPVGGYQENMQHGGYQSGNLELKQQGGMNVKRNWKIRRMGQIRIIHLAERMNKNIYLVFFSTVNFLHLQFNWMTMFARDRVIN